jgi:hypothetical protein
MSDEQRLSIGVKEEECFAADAVITPEFHRAFLPDEIGRPKYFPELCGF